MIGIGLLILLSGIVIYFLGDKLTWLGHLPGDIRVEKENFSFYLPITTMIVLSIILSLIFSLAAKIFR